VGWSSLLRRSLPPFLPFSLLSSFTLLRRKEGWEGGREEGRVDADEHGRMLVDVLMRMWMWALEERSNKTNGGEVTEENQTARMEGREGGREGMKDRR